MKKLLYITPEFPYPPDSGGKLKTWMLLKHLSSRYDLHLCLFTKTDTQKAFINEFLQELSLDLNHFYSENLNMPRNIKNLLSSYKKGIPLTVYRHFSQNFKDYIESIIGQFDSVFIDYFSMAQYMPSSFKGNKIMHTHNAEYVMWERKTTLEKNPLIKFLIFIESRRIKNYEKSIYKGSNNVLCVSSNDIENIKKIGIDENKIKLIQTTGDENLLLLPDLKFETTEKSLLFIGTLSWDANTDGLIWFIKNCWEDLLRNNPNIKLYVIGSSPGIKLQKAAKNFKNIILTGYVENLEEYYSKSLVFIAPLRFGSGIKVKVLNAMYRGIPTVTTPVGAEGIEANDMEHLGIANSAEGFIERIDELLNNQKIWEELKNNSRMLMKKNYAWNEICGKIDKILG